ncbi:hypothetical protein [Stappia indica]|uniref:hypothetical protein n=1 Tax=Stappia indica TaxID=538381 RepID=UPI001CD7E98E|nr:hypothetical protein [Stappia indica]MCA1299081.1 hypothetical protein [Stappia indica]
MSDAERTEIELEEDAFLPQGAPAETPFAELSRLMVIAIDVNAGDTLSWNAQPAPNGAWTTQWTRINDTAYSVLASGATLDGRVAMVAQTKASTDVQYIDEAPAAPDGVQRWNAPVSLGLPAGCGGFAQLAMTVNAGGRVAVFGVDDATGAVWWIYQNPDRIVERTIEQVPPGQTDPITITVHEAAPPETPWSDWQSLGTDTPVSRITLGNNADGRVLIAAIGPEAEDKQVYVNQQKTDVSLKVTDWTGWQRLDTSASGGATSAPAVVLDKEGAVNIFMIGALAQVVQIRQQPPGEATWSTWARLGMTGVPLVALTASFNAASRLVLVAIDENKGVHGNVQIDPLFQQWIGWEQIGVASGFGEIAMDYNADGRLTLFQRVDANADLQCLSQYTVDSTSWEAGWDTLAQGGIGSFGVVRDLTPPQTG